MLTRLTTSGCQIVRAVDGMPVRLRGVNRSGLEYSMQPERAIRVEEIAALASEWGCQIVRLPFNQDWVLRRPGYLDAIDAVIAWSAAAGMYTLLDLQWLDAERKIAPLPDAETPRVWRLLGERYRANPAVLFDLYNEPHDVSAKSWRHQATLLCDAVREAHPEALVFVSGVDWGYDLRGVQIDRPHVVYSTHVYRNKTAALDREQAFGFLHGAVPLFAGEWGGWDTDLVWGWEQARYFDDLSMGWTAWSWSDQPFLQRQGQPTPFGEIVRRLLREEVQGRFGKAWS